MVRYIRTWILNGFVDVVEDASNHYYYYYFAFAFAFALAFDCAFAFAFDCAFASSFGSGFGAALIQIDKPSYYFRGAYSLDS